MSSRSRASAASSAPSNRTPSVGSRWRFWRRSSQSLTSSSSHRAHRGSWFRAVTLRVITLSHPTSCRSRSRGWWQRPRQRARDPRGSDLEQLLLLVLEGLVHLVFLLVGELVELLLRPVEVVGGNVPVLLQSLEIVAGRPPRVPDGDPAVLGHALHHPHQLLAPLLGEGREVEPDDVAVVAGGQPEVGLLDRLLDGAHRRL